MSSREKTGEDPLTFHVGAEAELALVVAAEAISWERSGVVGPYQDDRTIEIDGRHLPSLREIHALCVERGDVE
jgi:hypothetical protein